MSKVKKQDEYLYLNLAEIAHSASLLFQTTTIQTNKDIMVSQYQTPLFNYAQEYTNTVKLRAITISSTVLAVALTLAAVTSDRQYQRFILLGSALGITQVGRLASGARVAADRINQDIVDISDSSRQQQLYKAFTEESEAGSMLALDGLLDVVSDEPVEVDPPKYDLANVAGENHLAVIGASGSGKTILTQWLIQTKFKDGVDIKVMDTDASPSDWVGLPVVGRGNDIGSIQLAMLDDLSLLQTRTELRASGQPVGNDVVRVIEEQPSLAAAVGEATFKGDVNVATDWLKKLLRRGRKYGVSVVLAGQEFSVKAMDLSGEGSVRNAFTILYLGSLALKQLDQVRDKEVREQLRSYLSAAKRPCLAEVGGQYMVVDVPDLTEFANELESYTPADVKDSMVTVDDDDDSEVLSVQPAPAVRPVDSLDGDDDSNGGLGYPMPANKATGAVMTVNATKQQGATMVVDIDDTVAPLPADLTLPNRKVIHGSNLRFIHARAKQLRAEGKSRTAIVKGWGYVGSNYQSGVFLYENLAEMFGSYDD